MAEELLSDAVSLSVALMMRLTWLFNVVALLEWLHGSVSLSGQVLA